MLGRWACQAQYSHVVDTQAVLFDRLIGRLQKELDSAMSRHSRLAEDDAYDQGMDPSFPRP